MWWHGKKTLPHYQQTPRRCSYFDAPVLLLLGRECGQHPQGGWQREEHAGRHGERSRQARRLRALQVRLSSKEAKTTDEAPLCLSMWLHPPTWAAHRMPNLSSPCRSRMPSRAMLESRSPMLPCLCTRKARGAAQADRRWRLHLAWVECLPLRIEVLEEAQRVSNNGWARGGCDGKGHEADLAEIAAGTELPHWEALRRQDRSGMGGRCEGLLRVATRVEPVATLTHASIRSHRTQTPPLEKYESVRHHLCRNFNSKPFSCGNAFSFHT